jgi:hypothetical protein
VRVVFYTSSTSGVGRLVTGMSVGNALRRKGVSCRYTIVHSSNLGHLAEDFDAVRVPVETEDELSPSRCRTSVLYKTLSKLRPDLLLVHHTWFMVHHFIRDLPGRKYYLSDQCVDAHFRVPLPSGELAFDPCQYDRVFAIEPFENAMTMESVNPLVLKNRDEIMPREKALRRLGLDGTKPVALYSLSGRPEYYDCYREKYAGLESEYDVVYTGTWSGNTLFPAVDYFNAVDLIVCGAGYNQVWETNFFKKKALFETLEVHFSDQRLRLKTSETFHFDENGADQLVNLISGI